MKRSKLLVIISIIAVFALMVTACSNSSNVASQPKTNGEANKEGTRQETVEIIDAYGTVTVPVNPKNVVALDNRTFETLADWGIELAAVPKEVMSVDSPYVADETVLDIGNHREPNLEVIAAVEPDLVIVGQRFAKFYEDIKALVPNAAVINLDMTFLRLLKHLEKT